MKLPWWSVLVAFVAGVGASYLNWNHQLATVKLASADSTRVAQRRDSAATHYADSLKRRVDSLQLAKRPVTIKITKDSGAAALADSAVRHAKTLADKVTAQAGEIIALKDEVVGLRLNAHTDSLSLWDALAAVRELKDSLHAQTATMVGLNAQIQALHAPPSLALKILKGASYVGAVAIGYTVGKRH